MGVLDRILRAGEGRKIKALEGLVPDINALEPETQRLSDDALAHKTVEFRERLDNGETLDDILVEAFAVVREGANRVIGQRHYDVQMMGGAALHLGWVAEMKTGEGKTLVSTLPVYLNALAGKGVHVITVNDYLATRDSEWMGQVHKFLGLSVGLIVPGNYDPMFKRVQYNRDITYGVNNEFGFDYLRDNMAMSRDKQVQRGHFYSIVDEVDSILIDEARTPLIISGKVAEAAQIYYKFASIAQSLQRDLDYEFDEEKRIVSPLEPGVEKVEKALDVDNLYNQVSADLVHHLLVALKAKELYRLDRDYVIQDGEVKIVDEFTGRILDGRRWSDGLHQAVEAKEGVKIKEENQTLATVTLQNYFKLYDKLAGMTGTAMTEAAEFAATYALDCVPIPTNRPIARMDQGDLIYTRELSKYEQAIEDIMERTKRGQPVLVGTVSVEKSELMSELLTKRGVKHEVLNAKQHFREADIVVQAGRLGAVTVATNMAGRGVDILLGGNPEGLAEQRCRQEGVDHESEEGIPIYEKHLGVYEAECKAEGETVRGLGGLYVLGTERHDSRRIDNQLRGRAGRQGDPGESRFYLSLEDDLMRLFATGAMNWVMNKAMPDDVPLEAKMVTKAIERAQTTVEQRNAEIRKNVLKYDEVYDQQRKTIWARRDQLLDGRDLRSETLEDYLPEAISSTIESFCVSEFSEEWDVEGLMAEMGSYWPITTSEDEIRSMASTDEIYEAFAAEAIEYYEKREADIGPENMREIERQVMLRVIDQRWRQHLQEMDYLKEGIGLRAMGQKDPLTEWQREGFEMFGQMLQIVAQDFLRYIMHVEVQTETTPPAGEATPGAAPANPVLSAPTSGSPLSASASASGSALGGGAAVENLQYSAPADPSSAGSGLAQETKSDGAVPGAQTPKTVVKSDHEKLGRNDPCWCGSGKKFKHCHG